MEVRMEILDHVMDRIVRAKCRVESSHAVVSGILNRIMGARSDKTPGNLNVAPPQPTTVFEALQELDLAIDAIERELERINGQADAPQQARFR